jgi:hypothetical protein
MPIRPFLHWFVAALLALSTAGCEEEPRRREPQEPARELSALLYTGASSSPVKLADIRTLLREALRPGLTARLIKDDDGTMLVVVARLELLEPGLRGVTADNPEGALPEDMLRDDALALLIGSGFVSELMALTPLGLLQINGEVVNRIQRHGYTRVLGIGDRRMGVVGHLQYERGLYHSALQVGPGVVEAGILDISPRDMERQPFFRSVVGTCGDHSVFASSLTPMHLHALGKRLLQFAKKTGLVCDEVVNLAGDRESIMALRFADGRILFIGNPRTSRSAVITLESVPAS